jgi:hypothetical protein
LEPDPDFDTDPDFDPDPAFDPGFSPGLPGTRSRVRSSVVPSREPSLSALDDVVASAGSRTGIGGFIDSYRS